MDIYPRDLITFLVGSWTHRITSLNHNQDQDIPYPNKRMSGILELRDSPWARLEKVQLLHPEQFPWQARACRFNHPVSGERAHQLSSKVAMTWQIILWITMQYWKNSVPSTVRMGLRWIPSL